MTPLQVFGLGQLRYNFAVFFLSFEFSAEWRRRRKVEAQLRKDINMCRDWVRVLTKMTADGEIVEGWQIGHVNYPDQGAPYFVRCDIRCDMPLACGGLCYRPVAHEGPHLCVGDFGIEGDCPA